MSEENPKPSDDQFLLSQGRTLWQGSRSARELIEQSWVESIDAHESRFPKDQASFSQYLGAPRLFIPKTYANAQRILVEFLDALFQDPDEIVDVISYKNVPHESKLVVKSLLNYRLNGHPIDSYQEFYEAGQDALKYKGCVMKVYPRLITSERPVMEAVTDPRTGITTMEASRDKTEEVVDAYSPVIKTLPPEDVFFSRRATWKDYWRYPIVHRYPMSRDEAEREGFKNVGAVGSSQDRPMDDLTKDRRHFGEDQNTGDETTVKDQEDILVYECWDFLPGEGERLVAGSYYLLGDASGPQVVGRGWEENKLPYNFDEMFEQPRPPFVFGTVLPEAHKMWGKSYYDITKALQDETNAQRNQEREAVARALRPTTYVNTEAEVDLMALVNRKIGAHVKGSGPANQAIQELQTMNPMAISASHQARTDADYEESGIPRNLMGAQRGEDTATEATQKLQNANKKVQLMLMSWLNTGPLPAFRYLLRLDQAYATDEFIENVTGKTLGWAPGQAGVPAWTLIQGDFELQARLGNNRQANIQRMMLIMDRINQTNMSVAQLVQLGVVDPSQVQFGNPAKALDFMLHDLGMRDTDEWKLQALPPPPEQEAGPGVASQPANEANPEAAISQTLPGGLAVV